MNDGLGFTFEFYEDNQSCNIQFQFYQNNIQDENFNPLFFQYKPEEIYQLQDYISQIENIQEKEQKPFSDNFQESYIRNFSSDKEISKQKYHNVEQLKQQRFQIKDFEIKVGKMKKWTKKEHYLLENYYHQLKGNWHRIAEQMKGRTLTQCKQYWHRQHKNEDKKKTKWTQEEDQMIKDNINQNQNNWAAIALILKSKTGKQIRERYVNKLRADIVDSKKQPWNQEQDSKLIQFFNQFGSKWSQIAKAFPGRSDLQVRNRMKKLLKDNISKKSKQQDDLEFKIQAQIRNNIDEYLDLAQTCEKPSKKIQFNFDSFNSQTFSFVETKQD
ncbi:unnamed protein product [Paramecium sonneborni]|uniref:Homeodomain protein n=1 Tax=Paramecium sonneborni TaxID=65129 RepID=A0A8S1K0R5_9CILI|nr:unnamed protein product [Paramecium sonneborni]